MGNSMRLCFTIMKPIIDICVRCNDRRLLGPIQ